MPTGRITRSARLLSCVMYFSLILVLTAAVFLSQDSYPDQTYNIGVIKFTAAHGGGFYLLTSLSAVFFEKNSIVRSEDWHRGLSLLIATGAYRILPAISR